MRALARLIALMSFVAVVLSCIAGRDSVFGNACTSDADCKDGRCGPNPFTVGCTASAALVCAQTCTGDRDCRNHADDPATCESSCLGRPACKSH